MINFCLFVMINLSVLDEDIEVDEADADSDASGVTYIVFI